MTHNELKIGNWVCIKDRNITIKVTEANLNTTPGYFYFCGGVVGINYDLSEISIWKPLLGDYIFCLKYGLCKVVEINNDKLLVSPIALMLGSQWIKMSSCEPFIEQLPSYVSSK